jgi:hypothetical protein
MTRLVAFRRRVVRSFHWVVSGVCLLAPENKKRARAREKNVIEAAVIVTKGRVAPMAAG